MILLDTQPRTNANKQETHLLETQAQEEHRET